MKRIFNLFSVILLIFPSLLFTNNNKQVNSIISTVIFIDPGHGGKDNGTSFESIVEDELNLKISKYLYESIIEDGGMCYLTRNEDYDLSYAYLSPKATVRVDKACQGIKFDDLSDRGKFEYVAICKEIYAALGESYNIFDIGGDCHDMDKSLERFRIVREPEAVEEPPKELTATQQKIAEWKESFMAWSAEVQAKNRERLAEKQAQD